MKGQGLSVSSLSNPYEAHISRRKAAGISGCLCVDCADDGAVGAVVGPVVLLRLE